MKHAKQRRGNLEDFIGKDVRKTRTECDSCVWPDSVVESLPSIGPFFCIQTVTLRLQEHFATLEEPLCWSASPPKRIVILWQTPKLSTSVPQTAGDSWRLGVRPDVFVPSCLSPPATWPCVLRTDLRPSGFAVGPPERFKSRPAPSISPSTQARKYTPALTWLPFK